ncbi:MAG: septum formation family protein [Pseudonocardiaceae bacterium]
MTSPQQRRRSLSTRRIAAGAMLGALAALLIVTIAGGSSGSNLLAGAGVGDGADTTITPPFEAPAGACLTWKRPDASDAQRVECAQPHLFEVTGTVDLANQVGRRAAFPADEVWRQLVAERCTPLSARFLAGRFDPFGWFSVGAIKPSAASWGDGDRVLRCGLQVVGRTGALYPTVGAAATHDQSDVHEPATCLGIDGTGVGDPVDCAQPHAVEVVGVVDLRQAFPGDFPDEAAQDGLLSQECMRLAGEFAGRPQIVGEKGLTVFWETLRPESWQAGSRRVDCRLGAFLPDRSGFAPVTGGVRGDVVVGTEPAPPAPRTQGPSPMTISAVPGAATPPPPAPPG